MNNIEKISIEEAEKALKACLGKVPFLTIVSLEREIFIGNFRADILVTLKIAEQNQRLLVEVRGNGQPRYARMAAYEFTRVLNEESDVYGVLLAPYISPRVADFCVKENMGYLDLAGNCRLTFGEVYIERQGAPNLAEKRELRSLYFPKSARILSVLLADPKKFWRVQALAAEAKVSLGQVSNVKKLLEDREWLTSSEAGLSIKNPEALLSEWIQYYNPWKSKPVNFYTLKSLGEWEENLAMACEAEGIAYALTGFSGAARYSATVRYQRSMAYVSRDLEKIAYILALKEVNSGANVTLLTPADEGLLYGARQINGICIASPVRVYLDLIGNKGRGEEAAEAVLNEVIKRSW